MYSIKEVGNKYSKNYKIYIKKENDIISPFHDIPLWINDNITVINEIPRFENGKFEINKKSALNPITQDCKNNKVRFVSNIFPFKGYPWNYGAIPQTFEDPNVLDRIAQLKGDNDPLDVIDISNVRKNIGDVYECNVLGCLAMIDGGECDWKILAIDIRDPLSDSVNDIEDVEKLFPNLLGMTTMWFRNYKLPDGKPANDFRFDGKFQNKKMAIEVIREAHDAWKRMMDDETVKNISKMNRSLIKHKLEEPLVISEGKAVDEEIDSKVFGYFYY
ncbi:Inorganic pyrophosphatase [Dictyocoela muelleri]|nr:Inorganic pyrophosphatase [Dictyocoela muelleri]